MSRTITFQLRGLHLIADERVAVVGSSPSLGLWVPKPTCYLKRTNNDSYQLLVTIEESVLEYKYVLLKDGQIQWEGGANRLVHPGDDGVQYDDTWVSEGASDFVTCEPTIEDAPDETVGDTSVDEAVSNGSNTAVDTAVEIAADTDENVTSVDDTTSLEVDENMPHIENVLPQVDDNKNGVKKVDVDSRTTNQLLGSTQCQRSPFLLIDSLFRMCGKGTTNAK